MQDKKSVGRFPGAPKLPPPGKVFVTGYKPISPRKSAVDVGDKVVVTDGIEKIVPLDGSEESHADTVGPNESDSSGKPGI